MNVRKKPIIITAQNKPSTIQNTKQAKSGAKPDALFKILLLGDQGVGKTCILVRFIENTFNDQYVRSYGVDFRINKIMVEDKTIQTQLWDTSAQEQSLGIQSIYYRGAHAAIVVFDVTDKASFNNVDHWLKQIDEQLDNDANIILVGSKVDETKKRVVSKEEVEEFINKSKFKIDAFVEASAKTGENVCAIIETATKFVFDRHVVPMVNKTQPKKRLTPREELIADLAKYIARIESHKQPTASAKFNFSFGFWHHKNSRAGNREANYHLAREWLMELRNSNGSIESIFNEVAEQRKAVISKFSLKERVDFKDRGINSCELNAVIKKAGKFVKLEKGSLQIKPR